MISITSQFIAWLSPSPFDTLDFYENHKKYNISCFQLLLSSGVTSGIFLTLDVNVVTRTYCICTWYYLAVLAGGLRLADALFYRVSPFPSSSSCANALFPLFFWCWKLRLLHERKVVPPDTHPAFWFDDCNWSLDCFALFFLLCVAKASSTLSIGLTNRANATTIAIDVTKSFLFLFWIFVLFISLIL